MLESVAYCPILYARVAEVKAYAQLSPTAKDVTLPIFLWRPWPNAKALGKTWERVGEAVEGRRFGFDLDGSKFSPKTQKPAQSEFNALFDEAGGFSAFYRYVAELDYAIPVLQKPEVGGETRNAQFSNVEDIERGAIWHIRYPASIRREDIEDILSGVEDLFVVVDAGWDRDLLSREPWVSRLVNMISDIDADTEIVVAGSSFPSSFSEYGSRGQITARERTMFTNISRLNNAAKLTYGDWGSTRPPSDPVPMKNVPRLDLPFASEWLSIKRSGDESYKDLAKRLIRDPLWPVTLKVWGTYAIEATADGVLGAISSQTTAAAARINVHLHQQAQSGSAFDLMTDDEPYTD